MSKWTKALKVSFTEFKRGYSGSSEQIPEQDFIRGEEKNPLKVQPDSDGPSRKGTVSIGGCQKCFHFKEADYVYCENCGNLFWKNLMFELIFGIIGTLVGISLIYFNKEKPDLFGFIFLAVGGYALFRIFSQFFSSSEVTEKFIKEGDQAPPLEKFPEYQGIGTKCEYCQINNDPNAEVCMRCGELL